MTRGIDSAVIERLVHTFYARVRKDPWLGPIFEGNVTSWGIHLARMCAFWESVTLATGVYSGQPMRKHLPLPVDGRHFDRWLELFEATAREVCTTDAAEVFIAKARRIAESLELGIASSKGVLLRKHERLHRADLPVPEEG